MYYRGAAAAIVVFDVTNPVCGVPNVARRARSLTHTRCCVAVCLLPRRTRSRGLSRGCVS